MSCVEALRKFDRKFLATVLNMSQCVQECFTLHVSLAAARRRAHNQTDYAGATAWLTLTELTGKLKPCHPPVPRLTPAHSHVGMARARAMSTLGPDLWKCAKAADNQNAPEGHVLWPEWLAVHAPATGASAAEAKDNLKSSSAAGTRTSWCRAHTSDCGPVLNRWLFETRRAAE